MDSQVAAWLLFVGLISAVGGLFWMFMFWLNRQLKIVADKIVLPDTPEPEELVDVRIMHGTWVVDGVRRIVAFTGRAKRFKNGDTTVTLAQQVMWDRLTLATKLGFIYDHDYEGYTTDDMIALGRISEISVIEDSYIMPYEED